jgi:hypothetical protein
MEKQKVKKGSPRQKMQGSRPRKKRQPKQAKNLPPPIEITSMPAKPEEKPDGLIDQLGSLFSGADNTAKENLLSAQPGIGSTPDSLPRESERILSSVPQTIGDEADDPGGPGDVSMHETIEDDPIKALMAQVAFEDQDVQDMIAEFFDWLAERFKSDHWKLNERQARMLGRPAAQLLNSMWSRLMDYLPEILSRWCEETPGATAFILACGIVIVPKVTQQVRISRERKKEKIKPIAAPAPRPQPIHDGNRPIMRERAIE